MRVSNKIWAICNRKGYKIDIVPGSTTARTIQRDIASMGIGGIMARRLEMLVEEYELNVKRRGELELMMAELVIGNDVMIALMQLPGVFYKTAFVTVAGVGDVHRFPKASKLAAYGGFAPVVDTSGKEEQRAMRKGGTGKPLDNTGRRDLKYFWDSPGTTTSRISMPRMSTPTCRLQGRRRHGDEARGALGQFPWADLKTLRNHRHSSPRFPQGKTLRSRTGVHARAA